MLCLNFQIRKPKKIIIVISAVAIIALICVISAAGNRKNSGKAVKNGREYSLAVKNDDEAEEFLKNFGIDAILQKTGEEKVIIPQTFNAVYDEYNSLQKQIGLDLTKYKGKAALKTTYKIRSDKAEYAVLLIRGGRVIGGHLTSLEYGKGNLPL